MNKQKMHKKEIREAKQRRHAQRVVNGIIIAIILLGALTVGALLILD